MAQCGVFHHVASDDAACHVDSASVQGWLASCERPRALALVQHFVWSNKPGENRASRSGTDMQTHTVHCQCDNVSQVHDAAMVWAQQVRGDPKPLCVLLYQTPCNPKDQYERTAHAIQVHGADVMVMWVQPPYHYSNILRAPAAWRPSARDRVWFTYVCNGCREPVQPVAFMPPMYVPPRDLNPHQRLYMSGDVCINSKWQAGEYMGLLNGNVNLGYMARAPSCYDFDPDPQQLVRVEISVRTDRPPTLRIDRNKHAQIGWWVPFVQEFVDAALLPVLKLWWDTHPTTTKLSDTWLNPAQSVSGLLGMDVHTLRYVTEHHIQFPGVRALLVFDHNVMFDVRESDVSVPGARVRLDHTAFPDATALWMTDQSSYIHSTVHRMDVDRSVYTLILRGTWECVQVQRLTTLICTDAHIEWLHMYGRARVKQRNSSVRHLVCRQIPRDSWAVYHVIKHNAASLVSITSLFTVIQTTRHKLSLPALKRLCLLCMYPDILKAWHMPALQQVWFNNCYCPKEVRSLLEQPSVTSLTLDPTHTAYMAMRRMRRTRPLTLDLVLPLRDDTYGVWYLVLLLRCAPARFTSKAKIKTPSLAMDTDHAQKCNRALHTCNTTQVKWVVAHMVQRRAIQFS